MSTVGIIGAQYLDDSDFSRDGRLMAGTQGKCKIVALVAGWCGHCKAMKPALQEFFDQEGRVDCFVHEHNGGENGSASEKALTARLSDVVPGFRGFPTLAMFGPDGRFMGNSDGYGRDAAGLSKWVAEKAM